MDTFLILPCEIRNDIYKHLFYKSIVAIPRDRTSIPQEDRIDPEDQPWGLTRACRQLYHETTAYFYGMNKFFLIVEDEDYEGQDSEWPEIQKVLETHLPKIYTLYIDYYEGDYDCEGDFEEVHEKFQWIVDTLIRTGGTKGEFVLKELYIQGYLPCCCVKPSTVAHVVNEIADMELAAERKICLKPLESLQGKIEVVTIKVTLEHDDHYQRK